MQTMRTASISLSTRCLFMWQLLTITRPAEAAEARWEEVDIEARVEDSCSTHENEP
jgi:integrase